jgi:hypothetical protein
VELLFQLGDLGMTAREITKNPPKIYDPKPADDYWITLIFETVGDNGDDPLR